jgi:hypothetical protein
VHRGILQHCWGIGFLAEVGLACKSVCVILVCTRARCVESAALAGTVAKHGMA